MKKRIIALIFALLMLAGCGKKSSIISPQEAQDIAVAVVGLTQSQVTGVHAHAVSWEDIPCYSIHVSGTTGEFEVIIDAVTGEVLHTDNTLDGH